MRSDTVMPIRSQCVAIMRLHAVMDDLGVHAPGRRLALMHAHTANDRTQCMQRGQANTCSACAELLPAARLGQSGPVSGQPVPHIR